MDVSSRINRREFLSATGMLSAAAALAACRSKETGQLAVDLDLTATRAPSTPTLMPEPATPTPEPREALLPEMVLIEPGTFMMGTDDGLPKEAPVHEVSITQPYFAGIYPVTNAEYARLCEETRKCSFPDDRRPVVGINWFEAVDYCNWLSEAAGLTVCYSGKGNFIKCDFSVNGYRLPTEAEWEFAARGGNLSEGFLYAGGDDPDLVAWYDATAEGAPRLVGEKLPNELGIYDMSGNVWEWCWDWYGETYYAESPAVDPRGSATAQDQTMPSKSRRGGGWSEESDTLRTSFRSADWISYQGGNGFRLVRTAL